MTIQDVFPRLVYLLLGVAIGGPLEIHLAKARSEKPPRPLEYILEPPRSLAKDRVDVVLMMSGGSLDQPNFSDRDPLHVYVSVRNGGGWYINRQTGLVLPCVGRSIASEMPCQIK